MKSTNHKLQRLLSILTTLIGITLLIFMIVVEDEPGAIPLILTTTGLIWFFVIRSKLNSAKAQS